MDINLDSKQRIQHPSANREKEPAQNQNQIEKPEIVDIGYVTFFPSMDQAAPAEFTSNIDESANTNEIPIYSQDSNLAFRQATEQKNTTKKTLHIVAPSQSPPPGILISQVSPAQKNSIHSKPKLKKVDASSALNQQNTTMLKLGTQQSMPSNLNKKVKLIENSEQERLASIQTVPLGQVDPENLAVRNPKSNKNQNQFFSSNSKQIDNGILQQSYNTSKKLEAMSSPSHAKKDIQSDLEISQLSTNSKLNSNHESSRFASGGQHSSNIIHLQNHSLSNKSQDKNVERTAMQILNSNEQVYFKFRTITPQSTTDDSANIQEGKHNDTSADRTQLSNEDTTPVAQPAQGRKIFLQNSQLSPTIMDPSQKPSTTNASDGKHMRVTKRLRQGTGESNKMRSSHYEHMKEAAKSGQKQAYVPTAILNQQSKQTTKVSSPKKKIDQSINVEIQPESKIIKTSGRQKATDLIQKTTTDQSFPQFNSEQPQIQKKGAFIIQNQGKVLSDYSEQRIAIQSQASQDQQFQNLNQHFPFESTVGKASQITETEIQQLHELQSKSATSQKGAGNGVQKQRRYQQQENLKISPISKESSSVVIQQADGSEMQVADRRVQMKAIEGKEVLSNGQVYSNFSSLDDQLSHYLSQREQQPSRELINLQPNIIFPQKELISRERFLSPNNQQQRFPGSIPPPNQQVDLSDLKLRHLQQVDSFYTADRYPAEASHGTPGNYMSTGYSQMLVMSPDNKNNKQLNQIQINPSSGLGTPNGHISRGLQNYPSMQKNGSGAKQVITPPTIITGQKRIGGYGRVYSPGNHHNHPYVEWLNSKNHVGNEFSEVTAHQANMIQKYSAGLQSSEQQRFYVSPRAGYATPLSPLNLQTAGLQDSNFIQLNSARIVNNSTMSGFQSGQMNAVIQMQRHNADFNPFTNDAGSPSPLVNSFGQGLRRDSSNMTSNRRQTPIIQQQVPKRQGQALLPDCFLSKITSTQSRNGNGSKPNKGQTAVIQVDHQNMRGDFRESRSNHTQGLSDQAVEPGYFGEQVHQLKQNQSPEMQHNAQHIVSSSEKISTMQ